MAVFQYTFTEDDGAREDCNIFYARYVIVLSDPANKPYIDDAVVTICGGRLSPRPHGGADIVDVVYADDDHPALRTERLVEELRARGYDAHVPDDQVAVIGKSA